MAPPDTMTKEGLFKQLLFWQRDGSGRRGQKRERMGPWEKKEKEDRGPIPAVLHAGEKKVGSLRRGALLTKVDVQGGRENFAEKKRELRRDDLLWGRGGGHVHIDRDKVILASSRSDSWPGKKGAEKRGRKSRTQFD